MLPLLAPIIAQLVTLSLGDHTEARYVATKPSHAEGDTRPSAALGMAFRRGSLVLSYGPSFLYQPKIGDRPSSLTINHGASLGGSYVWRHTTLSLTESVSYGQHNPAAELLAGNRALTPTVAPYPPTTPPDVTPAPAPGGSLPDNGAMGTTGTGNAALARALPRVVRLVSFSTGVSVSHRPSAATSVAFNAGYSVSGGLDADSRKYYPTTRGPVFSGSVSRRLDLFDTVSTTGSAQYSIGYQSTRTWIFSASERFEHLFDRQTTGRVGAGVSTTRTSRTDGLIGYGIYPTFDAGIAHTVLLHAGNLGLSTGASSGPVLDPVKGQVDPRVSANASVGWSYRRLSLSTSASTTLSLVGGNGSGAFNNVSGATTTAYLIGGGMSVDGGVRYAWQSYGGQATVPFTWAAFVGLSIALALPLNGEGR